MQNTTTPNAVPWSSEAEQAVLGALMVDPNAVHTANQRQLQPSHFFDSRNRAIWSAVCAVTAARHPVDLLTVFEHLRDAGTADDCGGLAYLNALQESVVSATNIGRHVDIVQEKATLRALMAAADEAKNIATEPGSTAAEKADRAATLFTNLCTKRQRSEPRALGELLPLRSSHWEALEAGKTPSGIPTHIPALDRALGGGLKPGKVIVLAARPSVGKTSLAGQIGLAVASQGHPVLILSQEMAAEELVDRFAANLGRVNLGALSDGRFADGDWGRVTEAMEASARHPVYIDDEPGLTLLTIRAKARAMKQRHGLAVVILDYIQLCAGSGGRETNRNQQIEELSRGLKVMAKELGVTVIELSQLSRKSVERGEPDLADLRDSGAIEQDADTVILLHPKAQIEGGATLVAAILAKNRQGRRGRIALAFHGATQRWVESQMDVSSQVAGGARA